MIEKIKAVFMLIIIISAAVFTIISVCEMIQHPEYIPKIRYKGDIGETI